MARRHYWQFLVTDEGTPIENADITITVANSSTPVFVYTAETGGAGTNTVPQIKTSRKGYFEFWMGDSTETQGYPYTTKFRIAWSAAGVSAGHIDYVDVFSTSVAPVNVSDVNSDKNKAVSNLLAKGWEDHKNMVLYTNGVVNIHGMSSVDMGDAGDAVYNKLVNNTLAIGWEDHRTNTTENHTQYPLLSGRPSGRNFTAAMGYTDGTIVAGGLGLHDFVTKEYVSSVSPLTYIVVDIGVWNMDTVPSIAIGHGLTKADIRTVDVMIAADNGDGRPLMFNNEGSFWYDSTNVNLSRTLAGVFDDTPYTVSADRGWIVIGHV